MKYFRKAQSIRYKVLHGLPSGVEIAASVCIVASTTFTILGFFGFTLNKNYFIFFPIGLFIVFIITIYIKGKVEHLPDEIVIEDEDEVCYTLTYETAETCKQFNQETSKYFGTDFLEDPIIETWRLRNPRGFIYIRNMADLPCAAMAIIALENSFFEQFIKGKLSEADIESDDILSFEETKKSINLYLAAIIVKDPHTLKGNRRAIAMVWGLIKYLQKHFNYRKKRKLYAVPINKSSENLLKRFGFVKVGNKESRKDSHDLYVLELTPDNLNRALTRIGDYSNVCKVSL
ncbi:MAG: hypothetical protein SFW35_04880 [Chitinophagales bacterium]|nr:hypothetical protein [Chitinophagales bacterium]